MFKRISKAFVAVALGLTLSNAAFSENPWFVTQMHSNTDGSIQMIELQALLQPIFLSSQIPALVGQKLVATDGRSEHSFTFTVNVDRPDYDCVGDQYYPYYCGPVGARALVATQGFADLGVVKPDFIVPNGFLFLPGGSLQIGTSSLPGYTYSYTAMPQLGSALAINNAGESYAFTHNYTGLWEAASGMRYAFPDVGAAASEPGWGINFTHQGNTIFATWFTYDGNGRPLWLSMTAEYMGYDAWGLPPPYYAGTIYRNTGASFSSAASRAGGTPAGEGTLQFNGDTTGLFEYRLNTNLPLTPAGGLVSKPIKLLSYGPVPTCVWALHSGLSAASNYQGLWWGAPAESEPGWGVNLIHQGTTIFATWFTYDADRNPIWLSVTATQTAPNTFSGALNRTTGSPLGAGPVQYLPAGSATFTFVDGNLGNFAFDVNLGDGLNMARATKAITRQVFQPPGTVCQ